MMDTQTLLSQALSLPTSDEGIIALCEGASLSNASAQTRLFASGDQCENFILIAEGTVRVQISTRTGRDIILYRLNTGGICALTTSCLLTDSDYYAEGIAETALKVITIPAGVFKHMLERHPSLSARLLDDYARRISELTQIIDRLTSRDLSAELKALLLARADKNKIVHLSHQKIAGELGSSREVISRKLKTLENSGLLTLSRGRVTLTRLI